MEQPRLDEQRLRRLIEVGRGLVSNLDTESVLSELLEVARQITGARYAALGILDESRTELERFLAAGIAQADREAIGDLPRGLGVLGELITNPRPLRLDDVGSHPSSYGFPPGHPKMRSFLGVPITIRGQAWGNLYLTEKQGGRFDAADEESAVILADLAAIAIENARLYRRVEDRKAELEKAVRRLEAMTAIAGALGGETELDRVLELIVKRGRALVGARWVAILLADRGQLRIASTAGELRRELVGLQVPLEGSVSGRVLKSRRPERVADVGSRVMISSEEHSLEARSALFAPLVFRGQGLGVLIAADRLVASGPEFDSEDERLLVSFAGSAATAVHTAKSVEAERLRRSIEGAEQERRHWARELHDETLQGLGGLQVLLSSGLRKRPGDQLEVVVREAITQIGFEIANLRALISELRPAALDEIGLVPAIESLAQRTASSEGIAIATDVELELEHRSGLAPEIETTVYRLVQEALTNVAKHAGASRVEVGLLQRDGEFQLTVTDDGRGFDPRAPAGGFGLTGMRERAALAGGDLQIDSSPGSGTTVKAVIPLSSMPQGRGTSASSA